MFLLFRGSAYCNGLQVGVLHGLHLGFLAVSFSISCIPKDRPRVIIISNHLNKDGKEGSSLCYTCQITKCRLGTSGQFHFL